MLRKTRVLVLMAVFYFAHSAFAGECKNLFSGEIKPTPKTDFSVSPGVLMFGPSIKRAVNWQYQHGGMTPREFILYNARYLDATTRDRAALLDAFRKVVRGPITVRDFTQILVDLKSRGVKLKDGSDETDEIAESFYRGVFEKLSGNIDGEVAIDLAQLLNEKGLNRQIGFQWLQGDFLGRLKNLTGPQADKLIAVMAHRPGKNSSAKYIIDYADLVDRVRSYITDEVNDQPRIRREVEELAISSEKGRRIGRTSGLSVEERLDLLQRINKLIQKSGSISGAEFVRLANVVCRDLAWGFSGGPEGSDFPAESFFNDDQLAKVQFLTRDDWLIFNGIFNLEPNLPKRFLTKVYAKVKP